jgi:predicted metal-dependent enzyme (double-stranded beta helix superfamily)
MCRSDDRSDLLEEMVGRIDSAVHALRPDPADVAAVLQGYLGVPDLLAPEHLRSSPDSYRTNVVHTAADGSFSLVALVWRPGQRTSIHSHRSWCVVGVHQGLEEERSFGLSERDGAPALEIQEVRRYGPGSVTWLSREDEIHDVANVGDSLAISLHVYGLDYRRYGSSILDTFDLPIAEPTSVRRHLSGVR